MLDSFNKEQKHILRENMKPGSHEHVTTTCISCDLLLTIYDNNVLHLEHWTGTDKSPSVAK